MTPTTSTWLRAHSSGSPLAAPEEYRLKNPGRAPLPWEASTPVPWIELTPRSGTLTAGGELAVQIAPSPKACAALAPGRYAAEVTFRSGGESPRAIERRVVLIVERPGASTSGLDEQSSAKPTAVPVVGTVIQRFGIRWTFDEPPVQGRFANGDPWVVGPVRIISITPRSKASGGRTRNGSMLNPSPRAGSKQGYDSAAYGKYRTKSSFAKRLNVALDVSEETPLELPPHSSLVSTASLPKAGERPQLSTAAILTVLPERAPEGAFRPPYCGKLKETRFLESNLDYTKLAKLAAVPSAPRWARVARMFERPWLDHVPGWIGRYIHPKENMPDYGREMTDYIGQASLMLHLDVADSVKRDLLVSFVQLGIDWHGILLDGGRANWQAGDGHHSGRKWPILFAGLMLDDPEMSGIGMDPELLFMGEDGQTFFVSKKPGRAYNDGHGGYGKRHEGMAEWGKKHALRPSYDNADWDADPYRTCCTANTWWGELLACRIMDAVELWNHPPLFAYQDRYFEIMTNKKNPEWLLSWSRFPIHMWRRYRPNY